MNEKYQAWFNCPGMNDELLDQLKAGYHTPSTVECNFTEDVEVLEGFVDASYLTNLGFCSQ